MRGERSAIERDVRGQPNLGRQIGRLVGRRKIGQRDRRRLECPGDVTVQRAALQAAQPLRNPHAYARRRRPRPVGLEADHPRRQEPEPPGQRGVERKMGQHCRFVRRLEAFERNQIVAKTDVHLRERIRIADRLQRADQRRSRRFRQRRDRRERFGDRWRASNTTGGEKAGGRGGEQHRATHLHVAFKLRANGGTPCRVSRS